MSNNKCMELTQQKYTLDSVFIHLTSLGILKVQTLIPFSSLTPVTYQVEFFKDKLLFQDTSNSCWLYVSTLVIND